MYEAEQSNVLRDVFAQLRDIGRDGVPRFSQDCIGELAGRLCAYNYGPMLLELCHLCRAAMLTDANGRFEWLFWKVPTARASAFRAAFAETMGHRSPPGLGIGAREIRLDYADGGFSISYSRMDRLAALAEFLVSTVGYPELAESLDGLGSTKAAAVDVSEAAKRLSRQVYAFLTQHLPSAQATRKFHAMIQFLRGSADGDFAIDDIDDARVLAFWIGQTDADADAQDFRLFKTTFLAFLRLVRLLSDDRYRQQIETALPLGPDFLSGEVDVANDHGLDTISDSDADPIDALQSDPAARVKAVNARELELLALPGQEHIAIRRLPLSYLRNAVFSAVQARLIQAVRQKAERQQLRDIAAGQTDGGYAGHLSALDELIGHLNIVAKASLYVIMTHKQRALVGDGADTAEPEILRDARAAFGRINRRGFDRESLTSPDRLEAFEALGAHLGVLLPRLGEVLRRLRLLRDLDASEAADRAAFSRNFQQMYGLVP